MKKGIRTGENYTIGPSRMIGIEVKRTCTLGVLPLYDL
jgi:hypothetical protein